MDATSFNSILMDRGDRVSIQGDGHPTMAAALTAFGSEAFELVARMLNATDSGCAGCRVVDDTVMAYPVYWTMSVNDYWWASGDNVTFLRLVPDMRNILDKAAAVVVRSGAPNLVWMGWDDRLGNGWCGTCNTEAQLTFATLLVRAHADFGRSLKHAGLDTLASLYAATAANLTAALRAASVWPSGYGLHSAANAINAAVATPAEAAQLFSRVFNDTTSLCSWSPFNQYWNLQALGNMGKLDHALASVRLCWGTQLHITSGCFLELWSPEWSEVLPFGAKMPTRPSYCHPWSSGVTHWLTEVHVGLRALTPGFGLALAAPHVSDANPHVGGTRETPHGRLQLYASVQDASRVRIELVSPVPSLIALPAHRTVSGHACPLLGFRSAGEEATLEPPRSLARVKEALNWSDAESIGQIHADVAASLGYSALLPPGEHVVEAVYESCSPVAESAPATAAAASFPPFGPAVWRAEGAYDRVTRGNWVTKYGKAGFVLFGFDNGTDVAKLPAWCTNVSAVRHGFPGVRPLKRTFHGASKANVTFLQPPPGSARGALRRLGSVGDECSDGCQGSVLDVNISRVGKQVTISVYLVALAPQADGPGHAAQLAIRAMDLQTLSPIARLPLVSDFEGGVLWSLTYDRGVRLRLMPVYGGATVSALFLDG